MSSVWGKNIKVSIFGESHGNGIGAVIDGFPAGLKVDEALIDAYMKRRAPGGRLATPRKEADAPKVLSGIYNGYTTGAPISVIIENTSQRSSDYSPEIPRPSHADYPAYVKYGGFGDIRGGGHYSGRLTAPLVFAGALAITALAEKNIHIGAHLSSIGDDKYGAFSLSDINSAELESLKLKEFPIIDDSAIDRFADKIAEMRAAGDSVGGVIECAVIGMPVGVGAHMFDSVEGRISSIIFGVSGVKGIEFGKGFELSHGRGSEMNDEYRIKDGRVVTASNNCGGIVGGMTTGSPVVFRVAMKPTPSVAIEQNTVNLEKNTEIKYSIHGRHDPCIALRAVPVIECAAALAVFDMLLDSPSVLK